PSTSFIDPTLQNETIQANNTVQVGVSVSVPGGCPPDTAYVNISVQPDPVVDAGPDVTIGNGQSTQLNANGIGLVTYSWSPAEGLNDTDIQNPIANPTLTTTYT